MSNPSSSKHKIKSAIPKLYDMIEVSVYGDIWERKELSKRDRSLITVAAMLRCARPSRCARTSKRRSRMG